MRIPGIEGHEAFDDARRRQVEYFENLAYNQALQDAARLLKTEEAEMILRLRFRIGEDEDETNK